MDILAYSNISPSINLATIGEAPITGNLDIAVGNTALESGPDIDVPTSSPWGLGAQDANSETCANAPCVTDTPTPGSLCYQCKALGLPTLPQNAGGGSSSESIAGIGLPKNLAMVGIAVLVGGAILYNVFKGKQ